MKKLIAVIILGLGIGLQAQTTTVTGTIKDLTNAVVTSGKVVFVLTPSRDTTISGVARFSPQSVVCLINGSGLIKAQDGTSTCTISTNTSLQPPGTYYVVEVWPYYTKTSTFTFYAVNASYDWSTVVPTPTTSPAQNFVDIFANQNIGGNKNLTGISSIGDSNGELYATNSRYGYTAGADLGLAVQAAYNSADCPATGCRIHIPAGTYVWTSTFAASTDGKKVLLSGDGDPATYISCTANPCIQLNYGGSGPLPGQLAGFGDGVRNLRLEGAGSGAGATAIKIGPVNQPKGTLIEGITIESFYLGIDYAGGFNITVLSSGIFSCQIGLQFAVLSEQDRLIASNISRNHIGALFTAGSVELEGYGNSWDDNDAALDFKGAASAAKVELTSDYFENAGGGAAVYVQSDTVSGNGPTLIFHGGNMADDTAVGVAATPLIDSSHFQTLIADSLTVFSAGRDYTAQGVILSTGSGTGVYVDLINAAPTALPTECVGCTARYKSFPRSGATAVTPWLLGGISLGFVEGGAGAAVAGRDVVYGDSTAHALKASYNNGSFFKLSQTIGAGTVTTPGTLIGAGACQAQTGITITGATTTDTATVSLNVALPATWQTGINFSNVAVTANTCTINLCNPTAGGITPTAQTLRCTVVR